MEAPWKQRTTAMLRQAFPHGLDDDDYRCVLHVLYDHLSDRNLAMVISEVFNRDYAWVLNDVYETGACRSRDDVPDCSRVQALLMTAGFQEWLEDI